MLSEAIKSAIVELLSETEQGFHYSWCIEGASDRTLHNLFLKVKILLSNNSRCNCLDNIAKWVVMKLSISIFAREALENREELYILISSLVAKSKKEREVLT